MLHSHLVDEWPPDKTISFYLGTEYNILSSNCNEVVQFFPSTYKYYDGICNKQFKLMYLRFVDTKM